MIFLDPWVLLQEDPGFFFLSCCRAVTILKFSFKYQTSLLVIKIPAGYPPLGSAKPLFRDCHPVLVHHGGVLLPRVPAEEWPREWKKIELCSGIWLFWELACWEGIVEREHHSASQDCFRHLPPTHCRQLTLPCLPLHSPWIYRAAAPSTPSQLDHHGAFPPHPAMLQLPVSMFTKAGKSREQHHSHGCCPLVLSVI